MNPVVALAAAFEEAARLNLEALNGIKAGEELGSLAPLFQAKQALNERMEQLLNAVGPALKDAAAVDAVGAALEAQARAARTEAQLSQELAKLVSLSGKVKRAYQQKPPQSQGKGWEVAG